jgi:antitoxin (DNA-binding transcriptional repressor) of toxin-antitoxin stability system
MILVETRIRATEAARRFSDVVNRVRYRGEAFVVVRGGEDMCRIGPAAPPERTVRDLVELLRAAPRPDVEYSRAVQAAIRRQGRLPRSPWRR